jgi:hypothetical protein
MEPVTLVPIFGNHPEVETNISAGRINPKESVFSFLQIIEALLNLQQNVSGRTDNKGEGDSLDPTVIGEKNQKEEKEQLNSSGQGVSLSPQNIRDHLLSIGTDTQLKQNNFEMADILELLSLVNVKGTDNSHSSETALCTTPLLGKVDLQNALQGSMTNTVQDGIPAYVTQESVQQNQGFSVLSDVVATAESILLDAAVKAEAVMPDSAQPESLLSDSPITAAEKKSRG